MTFNSFSQLVIYSYRDKETETTRETKREEVGHIYCRT